jgi:hypothetical protein
LHSGTLYTVVAVVDVVVVVVEDVVVVVEDVVVLVNGAVDTDVSVLHDRTPVHS